MPLDRVHAQDDVADGNGRLRILRADDARYVVAQCRVVPVDLDSGDIEVLYEQAGGTRLIAPNDLVFDGHGGFWFTDYGIQHDRSDDRTFICYAKADGSECREVMGPLDFTNGIGLSPDGSKLYTAETFTAAIWRS